MNLESPITAELLVGDSVVIREVVPDGELIWWAEFRPSEKGRTVICCRQADGKIQEVTPPEVSVDTQVHSYGGAAWWAENSTLYYQDRNTGILYLHKSGLLTELNKKDDSQFADGRPTPDEKYYVCIREQERKSNSKKNHSEPINEIVAVPTDGSSKIKVLVSGADFYSSPRISPDSEKLAWIQWNHPNMSWDNSELWVADILDGKKIKNAQKIAGSKTKQEWIFQPEWICENQLAFVSDENNWSTLSICDLKEGSPKITQVVNLEAEIAMPEWLFGESRYCFVSNSENKQLVYAAVSKSSDQLFFSDFSNSQLANSANWDKHSLFHQVRSYKKGVVALAGSWETDLEITYFHKKDQEIVAEVLHSPNKVLFEKISKDFFQPPEYIEFSSQATQTSFGLYYAPVNPDEKSKAPSSPPPLIVMAHGGPTAAARTSLYLGHRFWTSRGFAVLDVNYRGSTGFGRKYREALTNKWGQADVEDCIAGAKYLISVGLANPNQIGIRGGSAGGLTVLLVLAHSDVFSCGALRYGVVDIQALFETTHKFESRYLERLVGKPETFKERSPITHIDKLNTPLLIMSGTEDPVVPAEQSQKLANALAKKGIDHELLMFEGEGHGFRQAASLIRALNAELDFFQKVFAG